MPCATWCRPCPPNALLDTRAFDPKVSELHGAVAGDGRRLNLREDVSREGLSRSGFGTQDGSGPNFITLGTCDFRTAGLEERLAAWADMVVLLNEVPGALGYKDFYPQQKIMIAGMYGLVAHIVFGPFLADVAPILARDYGLTSFNCVMATNASRQQGKTTVTAAVMAAAAMTFSSASVALISTGTRASCQIMKDVMKTADALAAARGGVLPTKGGHRSATLVVLGNGAVIEAYPGKPDTVRGKTPNFIYYDETAHSYGPMLPEFVLPLLTRPQRALFMTGTPHQDPMNIYNLIMKALNPATGDLLVTVVNLALICDACKAAKVTSTCPHREHLINDDVVSAQTNTVASLMKAITSEATVAAETMGIVLNANDAAFPPEDVEAFQLAHAVTPEFRVPADAPGYVIVAVDPSGGGSSEMAIVSGYGVQIHDFETRCVVVRTRARALCWHTCRHMCTGTRVLARDHSLIHSGRYGGGGGDRGRGRGRGT
jgi:hypothetical protein